MPLVRTADRLVARELSLNIPFGNPRPTEWSEYLLVTYDRSERRDLPNGEHYRRAGLRQSHTLEEVAAGVLESRIGRVRDVRFGGEPVVEGLVTTRTSKLTWTAPPEGTPTLYTVELIVSNPDAPSPSYLGARLLTFGDRRERLGLPGHLDRLALRVTCCWTSGRSTSVRGGVALLRRRGGPNST